MIESFSQKFRDAGIKYDCDKIIWHEYHLYYGDYLGMIADKEGGMMEIGVQNKNSIRIWLELFPKLYIYGLDIDDEITEKTDKYEIIKADQSKEEDLENVIAKIHHPLWLIMDDGSHVPEHQLLSFNRLFPLLQQGGVYIIEDIECSYWRNGSLYGNSMSYGYKHANSLIEIFKDVIDDVNREYCPSKPTSLVLHTDYIKSITFSRNCIIITKGEPPSTVPYRFHHFL